MNTYLLFKSIHLIAVISWMAGLLYLPRIFVYHSEAVKNNKSEDLMETFKVMERRLFIYIMNPAMILSWIFGLLLIHTIGTDNFGFFWLQLKLIFVIILTIYHFFLFQCLRKFAENELALIKGIGNNSPEVRNLKAELKEVKADNRKLAEQVDVLTHTPNRLRKKGLI